uniref:Uncharacterized protein n=1 Tax=Lotharella globosa TaxID=91324 RepID=A0A7S3YQB3_9EUKA
MFPAGDTTCIREGKVNFSGNNVQELVTLAENMRQKGQTGDERYRILMRILGHIVKQTREREAQLKNFNRIARTEQTSAGLFNVDQYSRLGMQIDSLRSLLTKKPGVAAQIRPGEPPIALPGNDSDPCSTLTELMAVQIYPSEVDAEVVGNENNLQLSEQLEASRTAVEKSIEACRIKGKPIPIDLRLMKARLSQDIREAQDKLRREVVNSLSPIAIVKGEFRHPQVLEAQQRQQEKMNRRNRIRENKRKERARKEFLNAICNQHRRVFNSHHREQRRHAKNLAKAVIKEIQIKVRKREEVERMANSARLKALREKDEKKYLELLMEAKNERLMSLLKQTEEYMEKIGATIQAEQERSRYLRSAQEKDKKEEEEEEENEDDMVVASPRGIGIDIAGTRKRYYNIAHKYKEIVTEQPKALVFGTLRDYQMAGLQWLVSLYNNNLNGILADEMGLGKTIQSISLLAYVMEKKNNNGPFLVIAPMSTLHNNWATELGRWVPSMACIVYDGTKEARKKLREEDMATGNYNVLLTTFEFAMRDKKYLRKTKWQYIIVDEAHRLKNPKCKLVSDLNEYNKGARRIALSGTPLQNDLPELWSLLNFLHPSIFNSCDNFQQWFSAPLEKNLGAEGTTDMDMNEEEKLLVIDRLHSILRPFVLRREKSDVESQLQDKIDVVLRCNMSPVQKALYEAIRDGKVSMHNRMVQLRKICNHPYLFHPFCRGVPHSYRYLIDDDLIHLCSKFRLLDNILPKFKAKNHRVLLFNQMTKSMDIIGHFLDLRKYRYLRLDGMTAAHTRAHNLKLFNAKDSPYFMFILSTKAGGLGLNLQSADTVILFDSDWNPQNDMQAQARAHRIGQRAKVISIRFVTVDTIEEKVLQTANNKRDVEAMVIQAGGFNRDYKADEASKLVKEVLRKGQDDESNKVSELDFINRSIARDEKEYEFYSEMDKGKEYHPPPEDKYPMWVWDFLFNGQRATETKQALLTRPEAVRQIERIAISDAFGDGLIFGKRRSRKKTSQSNDNGREYDDPKPKKKKKKKKKHDPPPGRKVTNGDVKISKEPSFPMSAPMEDANNEDDSPTDYSGSKRSASPLEDESASKRARVSREDESP